MTKSPFQTLTSDHIEKLRAIVGAEHISTSQADLDQHSRDQSRHKVHAPEVVVWAKSTEQVVEVVKLANEACIPVTAWGAGTSIEGNPIPVHGGILLSFARMLDIVEMHLDDFQVTVQPGIGHKDLNQQLSRYGLFFPPDPGANASIGGMIANNAAGIRTVKYGATKDNVLKMKVVLADGRLITVGSRSVKQSSGYNLMGLLIGSEGTLGIVTEATLKLAPIEAHMSAVLASFPTVQQASEAVVALRGSGLHPAALELLGGDLARIIGENSGIPIQASPTLFLEFHAASPAMLEEGLEMAHEICEEMGAIEIQSSSDTAQRAEIWKARHHAYETMVRLHPNQSFYVNDTAVPISVYPELIAFIEERKEALDIPAYLVGHAGDGNIHVTIGYENEAEYQKALQLNDEVVRKGLELGGTATGEHGVGLGKMHFMESEHGLALDVMRSIKHTLDPKGILNPGKIFN